MATKGSNHYVDNKLFMAAMVEYRAAVIAARANGTTKPIVSRYIGECLLKIATHISYKPNFINYTFREDMIGDGIENCIRYIDNFDPDKGFNPFAYFSQIVHFAFIRRILKEKKQTLVKGKILMNMPFDAFELQGQDQDGSFTNGYADFIQSQGAFGDIVAKEDKRMAAKKKKKMAPLESILEANEVDQCE